MKVCVVTVYNSINSGSFWQAEALKIILNQLGIDVVYLKRKNSQDSSSSLKFQLKVIAKKFLKYGIFESKRYCQMYKEFRECQKTFSIISNTKKDINDIDLFILGSDTIWNLDSSFFSKNYKTYFGGIFENKDVISYAASIGNTSVEKIKKYEDVPEMLNNLKGISVRDEATYQMVKDLSKKNVQLVCDPTMLLTKDDYVEMEKTKKESNYIFLYLGAKLSKSQADNIKEFAKKNNLKIIGGIRNDEYCDKCIVNTPYNFLNYMIYADYVITDTFHGTIFSVNLEKNFVVIDENKKKVNDFINMFKLTDRLIKEESITNKFVKEINYDFCREEIKEFREKSLNFLRYNLKDNFNK